MELTKSPLAPASFPAMPEIDGVDFFTGASGDYYGGRDNILLVRFAPDTSVAGVLTQSQCASAPVDWCRANLPGGRAAALVVNAGNANAFSGRRGAGSVEQIAQQVAKNLGCEASQIMFGSTGVIGEPLDAAPVLATLEAMTKGAPTSAQAAAQAIMTTDTYAKGATSSLELDGETVNICGITKGSGMIAPDMATMLAFVFTDMPIAPDVLQFVLAEQVQTSFNAITVDSDTSTSDTCLVFATGAAEQRGVAPIDSLDDPRLKIFSKALHDVLFELAMQIVRDGEGATKFITIEVTGAQSDLSAKKIAMSVANSPLVKTAVAGEDANWGRVVMAVGKAGEPANRDRLQISFGDLVLAQNGERTANYDEAKASTYMAGQDLFIGVDVGVDGSGTARVYTCDLTHGYIEINGDYRS